MCFCSLEVSVPVIVSHMFIFKSKTALCCVFYRSCVAADSVEVVMVAFCDEAGFVLMLPSSEGHCSMT